MDNNTGKLDSPNGTAKSLDHDMEIMVAKQLLMQDGYDAQKGSRVAQSRLLETTDWLKESGFLNSVVQDLEDAAMLKVKRKPDGTINEIIFDKQIPGYPPSQVKVDIEKDEVNTKGKTQLGKEAVAEKREFLDALAVSGSRHLPDNEKSALTASQKTALKNLEEAYGSGDLASIEKMFQSNSRNEKLWDRLARELSQDFNAPDAMQFGKDSKGSPYVALTFENYAGGEINFESLVISKQGDTKTYKHNENGVPDLSRTSSMSTKEAWASIQTQRDADLTKKLSDYRCDFDEHERRDGRTLGAGVKQQSIVDKYNTYKKHYCGDESQD